MTLLEDPPETTTTDAADGPKLGEAAAVDEQAIVARLPTVEPEPVAAPAVSPLLASGAACLATAAAGWVVGGVFVGITGRLVGVLASVLGAAMVAASHRTRSPNLIQFFVLPLAIVGGAILVAPDATGGTANLPGLVAESLRSGGLATPPVPFDPGWRFLVVLLLSSVAVTAAALAIALARPRLAVFTPVPVTFAALLLQPPGAELPSVIVALVLTVGALAVAYGADLATQGATGGEFEVRRFAKAAAIIGALVAALIVLTQVGLLLPQEQESKTFPPKRPTPPPPAPDRVIFTVKSDFDAPWRLGVLDVYDDSAWMTPPVNPKRLVDLGPGGAVPGTDPPPADRAVSATFEILDLEGHVLPSIAAPRVLDGGPGSVKFDPRTQQFQTAARTRRGTGFTVVAHAPPGAADLLRAPAPPADLAREFTRAPDPPPEVQDLLIQIPDGTPLYERLQFVRTKFYESVVAAGAGSPVDVPPARAAEILGGAEATPFEITATEVLLARWAGVPARIGYGYYGGEKNGEVVEIRPRHGAMWLEAYFEGPGWVSIVGRPPQARSSLNQTDKIEDPLIRPTEELGATVYVPLRARRVSFISDLVRYWLGRVLPVLALVAMIAVFYVGPLRAMRRVRRRAWANRRGPRERIAVAYSELRDYAIDLNIGHPTLLPIEFLDVTVPDVEHSQLAWVVTRSLWGDLARDCRSQDAVLCEAWAHSLKKRIAAEQTPVARVVAVASRASFRDPYTEEIPNLWWPWSPRQRVMAFVGSTVRRTRRRLRRARLRRAARRSAPSTAAWLLILAAAALLLPGCVRDVALNQPVPAQEAPALPEVPSELGGYRFEPDPRGEEAFRFYYDDSLAFAGRVYAVRGADAVVQATLQTTVLKPALKDRARSLQQKIMNSIGGNLFKPTRIGDDRVYTLRMPEQRMLLAFGRDGQSYQLLVATQAFEGAERLFAELLATQQGEQVSDLIAPALPPPDPRRGVLP